MMSNHKKKNKQNESNSRRQGILGLVGGGKRPWVILIFAAAVLMVWLLLGSMRKAGSAAASNGLSTFPVRSDDLTITVTEGGSIKARKEINIKSEVYGRATIISIVPEGSYITREDVDSGKVLVELDSASLEERLREEESELASAEATLTEAQENYNIQLNQNESDITAAQLAVKFALMDLQKYMGETAAAKLIEDINKPPGLHFAKESQTPNPSNPISGISSLLDDPNELGLCSSSQMLGQLNDQIKLTDSRLQKAEYEMEGYQKLYDANYTSEFELISQKLNKDSAEMQKEQAITSLELFKRYEFPKETERLVSNYIEATRELDRTLARARSRMAQAQARLSKSEADVAESTEDVQRRREQVAACIIRAPAPGLVVYASSSDFYMGRSRGGGGSSSSSNIDEGETVYERQKIITLPDTSEMIAEIAVHESSVNMVRQGQRANIVIDAFPDETLQGEVLKIATLPDSRRGFMNPDLKVYTTDVSIEGTHDFLKPGMSAKVTILVEQLRDVLIVPIQVVANRSGRKVCYVATPGGPQEREVQTGAFNDTFVQITDGLQVGDEVLLNPPRVTEASSEQAFQEQRKQPQDKEPPQAKRPSENEGREAEPRLSGSGPQGRQFELTGEVIELIMGRMAENNPERAEELKQLRQSDPEKFKAELTRFMQTMRERMGQGKGGMKRRPGDEESGQNRGMRRRPGDEEFGQDR